MQRKSSRKKQTKQQTRFFGTSKSAQDTSISSFQHKDLSGMVVHAFNPSTWEAEADGSLSSRPAWSTE
ncbi:mCG1031692 [Mus musculus]|nr:mCG1031692 [Mus musculus]